MSRWQRNPADEPICLPACLSACLPACCLSIRSFRRTLMPSKCKRVAMHRLCSSVAVLVSFLAADAFWRICAVSSKLLYKSLYTVLPHTGFDLEYRIRHAAATVCCCHLGTSTPSNTWRGMERQMCMCVAPSGQTLQSTTAEECEWAAAIKQAWHNMT